MRRDVWSVDVISSRRWFNRIPFALALGSLGFLLWSAHLAWKYPYDGVLDFNKSGEITELDDFGEKTNGLKLGDVIVSVAGVPFRQAVPFYRNHRPEDKVGLIINRNGEETALQIKLEKAPPHVLVNALVPLLVALIFWGIGVGVKAFQPSDITSDLFFLVCQVSSLLLAALGTKAAGLCPLARRLHLCAGRQCSSFPAGSPINQLLLSLLIHFQT